MNRTYMILGTGPGNQAYIIYYLATNNFKRKIDAVHHTHSYIVVQITKMLQK